MNQTKTTIITKEKVTRSWKLIDLSGKTLGRAATDIAKTLIGKDKPGFSYHIDGGDYVVAINAKDIVVTGKKLKEKLYYHHSAFYAHGAKEINLKSLLAKDPRRVITIAVAGMLPKNKLRRQRLTRLKVFVDSTHPYGQKVK